MSVEESSNPVSEVSPGRLGHVRVGVPEMKTIANKPHSIKQSCYICELP